MQNKNSVVVARMVEGSRPTKPEDKTEMTRFVRFEFVLTPPRGGFGKTRINNSCWGTLYPSRILSFASFIVCHF
jgi:hypothetical protein